MINNLDSVISTLHHEKDFHLNQSSPPKKYYWITFLIFSIGMPKAG